MLSYLTFDHIGPLDTGTNNVYIINLFCMHEFSSVFGQSVCELFRVVRKLFCSVIVALRVLVLLIIVQSLGGGSQEACPSLHNNVHMYCTCNLMIGMQLNRQTSLTCKFSCGPK